MPSPVKTRSSGRPMRLIVRCKRRLRMRGDEHEPPIHWSSFCDPHMRDMSSAILTATVVWGNALMHAEFSRHHRNFHLDCFPGLQRCGRPVGRDNDTPPPRPRSLRLPCPQSDQPARPPSNSHSSVVYPSIHSSRTTPRPPHRGRYNTPCRRHQRESASSPPALASSEAPSRRNGNA